MNTPSYIKSLVVPTTQKQQGRKVWSIDLQEVWIPFFTATNAQGDTSIPPSALGCPLRLGYDKAGQVRFSQAGRPIIRVAKELSDGVRMVRDNFTANLIAYAGKVANDNTEKYKAMIEASVKAGEPIRRYDANQLEHALELKAKEEAEKEAELPTEKEAELVNA